MRPQPQRTITVPFKDWMTSKTLWFNALAFLIAMATFLSGPEALAIIPDAYEEGVLKALAFIVAFGNFFLRTLTTQPLKPILPQGDDGSIR